MSDDIHEDATDHGLDDDLRRDRRNRFLWIPDSCDGHDHGEYGTIRSAGNYGRRNIIRDVISRREIWAGAMQTFRSRLAKLESTIRPPSRQRVVLWSIQGPRNMPEGASVAFLRTCGHDVRDEDRNIIRIFIAPGMDLPLKDLTREHRR